LHAAARHLETAHETGRYRDERRQRSDIDRILPDGGHDTPDAKSHITLCIERYGDRVVVSEPRGDIEGLGVTKHDAIIDFARTHAHQCGYATSGELVAADGGEADE
jgi:aerobic-type carbon monoxide dehydrogenase small subunit (CoxS/CutS family)